MIAAHIEDTTIKQIWGDKREFERRVDEYCQREGLKAHYVQDMKEGNRYFCGDSAGGVSR